MLNILHKIEKRNGVVVPFNEKNIEKALINVLREANAVNDPAYDKLPGKVSRTVFEELFNNKEEDFIANVNDVHKLVENTLMDMKFFDIARSYIEHRKEHSRDIFKKRVNIKPYEYPELISFIDAIRHSYWVHTEFNYNPDIQDLKVDLEPHEVQIVERTMLAISQIESAVKEFWGKIGNKLPKPEIKKIGATFSESEVRHEDAYSNLIEIMGLNKKFEELKNIPAINDRIKYLERVNQNNNAIDNKDFFESIILFSMFIENVSLFSQFLIIMSYYKHGRKLKGMSNAVEATSKEENIHAMFGFDLVKIIKTENPDWWTDELVDYIYNITRDAYKAEVNIVNWIYEGGDSKFAKKDQTIEYIKKRLNDSLIAIDLKPIFDINLEVLAKTMWFDEEIEVGKDTDFFNKRSTAYTKKTKSITEDDLF